LLMIFNIAGAGLMHLHNGQMYETYAHVAISAFPSVAYTDVFLSKAMNALAASLAYYVYGHLVRSQSRSIWILRKGEHNHYNDFRKGSRV
jgi:hypothetical protein